jgi:hypothetical protein
VLEQLARLTRPSSPPPPIEIGIADLEDAILDAVPTPVPLPPPTAAKKPGADFPDVQRQLDNVTVQFQGHIIRIDCAHTNNVAQVLYDGRVMARVRPAPEASSRFHAVEDGAPVSYEVVVRGGRRTGPSLPMFTIRRNGYVLYNDR